MMIQYSAIAILAILLIVLCCVLIAEKKKNREKIQQLEESIEKTNERIESNKKALVSYTDDVVKDYDTQNQKAIISLKNERSELLSNLESEITKLVDRKDATLLKDLESRLSQLKVEEDKKIKALTQVLVKLKMDNDELRKKLEFFTEIDEDSRNLTENENVEERDALIQKALEELSVEKSVVSKEEVIDEKKDESEEPYKSDDTNTAKEGGRDLPNEPKKPVSNAPGILDDEQKVAFTIMNNSNENLFITGKAGTGKSFLLDIFVRASNKKTLKLAPTGIAALNIGGATLHTTFGYGNLENLSVENISPSTIRIKSEKRRILQNVETIIIDEISMVRVDTFDKIDKILRIINKSAKPFGGKQLIVFGDLFQLPPIANYQEKKYLTDYYGGIFFFNSNAYGNGQFRFIELTVNHRQKNDLHFFEILNRMREGKVTNEDINILNTRYMPDKEKLRRVLTLFPKKVDAERLNKEELAKIEAKEYKYKAKILYNAKNNQNPYLESSFPITDELHLKRGALVMMVANDPEKRWVNGSMGIVRSLGDDFINVTIDGTTYEVKPCVFTEKEAVYENGMIEYHDILQVEQYPVVLAYAITIHKSQGMTYKQVACDISKCFAAGQSYVALSRCSGMNGLYLLRLIDGSQMRVDTSVMNFYLQQSSEETMRLFE